MTATRAVPIITDARPLAAVARPARGREAAPRFAYAVCYRDQLDRVGPVVAAQLEHWTGPTRLDPVAVASFGAADVDDVLDRLGDLEEDPGNLLRIADDLGTATARHPGREVRLVVATTRALWPQAASRVRWS